MAGSAAYHHVYIGQWVTCFVLVLEVYMVAGLSILLFDETILMSQIGCWTGL